MGQTLGFNHISRFITALLLGGILAISSSLVLSAPSDNMPKLVVSNKPLALVVKAVVGDLMDVEVLIPQNADPHQFQLKPSDMLKVQRSDLLVWLSPELEPNLAKLMVTKNASQRFGLAESLGLNLLPLRESVLIEGHDHENHHHPHALGHLEGLRDIHVWTSPSRMVKFAQGLSASLQKHYPEYNEKLNTQFKSFEQSVNAQLTPAALGLESLEFSNVVFYHDAFQYFENEYGINSSGYLLQDLEQKLTLRQMLKVKSTLSEKAVRCVVVEPGFNPKLLQKLFGKRYFDTVLVSPLADEVEFSANGYVNFIRSIADGIKSCVQ